VQIEIRSEDFFQPLLLEGQQAKSYGEIVSKKQVIQIFSGGTTHQ
jgi:hypothetical protein